MIAAKTSEDVVRLLTLTEDLPDCDLIEKVNRAQLSSPLTAPPPPPGLFQVRRTASLYMSGGDVDEALDYLYTVSRVLSTENKLSAAQHILSLATHLAKVLQCLLI